MNSVERVKSICKERKIPISKLERDLNYGNGYISQLRKGVFPDDRLAEIAKYLSVSATYLMTGEDTEKPAAMAGSGLDEKFLTLLKQLTPDEIQRVGDFVQGILSSR